METQETTNGQGPSVAKASPSVTVTVPRGALTDALKLAIGHASKDGTRPHLCGVLFEVCHAGDALRLVATDGHRLAKVDVFCTEGVNLTGDKVLVSLSSAKNLLQIVKCTAWERDLPCMVSLGAKTLDVRPVGGSGLTVDAVDENFPPYDKVIPSKDANVSFGGLIGLNAGYVADACRLLKPFAHEKSGGVQVRVYGDREPIRIDAEGGRHAASATVAIMPMRI